MKYFRPVDGHETARMRRSSSSLNAKRRSVRSPPGSLSPSPALQRMLVKGWVTAEWVPAGPKRRARVYRLTPAGRRQLATEVSDFTRVMQAIVRVIEPA